MTSIQEAKQAVRQTMKARLEATDAPARTAAGERVASRVVALPEFDAAVVVSCFLSLPREISTDGLIRVFRRSEKRVCVPAFQQSAQAYSLARLEESTRLVPGKAGVREPVGSEWVALEDVDLFVIPGLAFDAQGHRVGRGGGHYDRLLEGARAVKVGVGMECQLVASVPAEDHDIRMDVVVTDMATLRPGEPGVEQR